MIEFIRPYYNQAKEIAKHFSPYNPEDCDGSIDFYDAPSDFEQDSDRSSSSSGLDIESADKVDLRETDEVAADSQFTLVGSSQTNFSADRSSGMDSTTKSQSISLADDGKLERSHQLVTVVQEAQVTSSDDFACPNDHYKVLWAEVMAQIVQQNLVKESSELEKLNLTDNADLQVKSFETNEKTHSDKTSEIQIQESETKSDQISRKALWADNMVKIIDQYLIEDSPLENSERSVHVVEIESSHSSENLSKDESNEPLYNTPVTEQLDFAEVSRQIYELDPQFDQSEAFYAEQCAAYWDARGWLPAIESNECDEDMLDSIEYHRRVLLDRVKTRLEMLNRDRINRELLFKASSFLEVEETCKKIAEEAANAKHVSPKENILETISSTIVCVSYSITTTISKAVARYLWAVGSDAIGSCTTAGTEISNIILGEEFSIAEYVTNLAKLTPEQIFLTQLETQKQIFRESLDIAKSMISTWWQFRIKIYAKIYSAGNTLLSSSISALSHSTSPVARLSNIISMWSGLFRS